MSKLPSPRLTWRDDGSPVSSDFGDIYFSVEDGLAETRHVFLEGNHLPDAWSGAHHFTIGETGFGTGLNFLSTWALWRETAQPHQHLHYVSVEGFPLSKAELARALAKWPELEALSAQLCARYPEPVRGTHLLHLADNVHLTLLEDDALPALRNFSGQIDAWFLDGFSPSANPDMWSSDLFGELARLSHVGTSFATFTVAGAVRRGLADAGFDAQKIKGHGRKREMLAGIFKGGAPHKEMRPWFQIPTPAPSLGSVAVLGAGIAGMSTARALRQHGFEVTLFDAQGIGAGASGNPAGLIMPRLAADESADGRLHAAAYLHTERFLSQRDDPDIFHATGVLQLARTKEEAGRFETISTLAHLPDDHMQFLSPQQVTAQAGLPTKFPALLFPKAGVVYPKPLLEWLIADAEFQIAEIATLTHSDSGWLLLDRDGRRFGPFDQVVLANGTGMTAFNEVAHLPVEPIQGQVSLAPAGALPPLAYALSAGSYAISLPDGRTLFGATYTRTGDALPTEPTRAAHQRNIAALGEGLPFLMAPLTRLDPASLEGRVAYRAQVPDRIPFAGPAPDHAAYLSSYDRLRHGDRFADYPPAPCHAGLFVIGGLGARGFSTSFLLADLLAAEMGGAPLPLGQDLLDAVHPARFIIRALRKNA
ncbi:MAG: bifunctional tRNA (5-methylaminomethyl-2-thiouridine)(34)-methyltransferase MnmD/FAD-dependent 5-carboxymethylaminomethyl-2-thiouridine(34) oxidoreductase MnmC [Parvibaculum sp.]